MNKPMTCEICGKNSMLQQHHLFSQSKVNKKLYPDFIHDKRNIMILCADCHLNGAIKKYTEQEFCEVMGIEVRSKTGKQRMKNV
jgi:RecJ-like exonuclease